MKKLTLILLVLGLALAGCNGTYQATTTPEDDNLSGNASQIGNPASVNCIKLGGRLKIKRLPNLGEYGVCYFEDNRQCEEWALFRGECPVGGVKVTGYDSEAQIFCAICGGSVDMAANTCTIDGKTHDTESYYAGEPPKTLDQ